MVTVYVMIGLPGSGKSTVAAKIAKEKSITIVSSDAIREELFGNAACQEHNDQVFQVLFDRVARCIDSDNSVIIDCQNISFEDRKSIFYNIGKYKCKKVAVFVATPYITCLKRNIQRERHVPEHVIKRSYMRFSTPCTNEGFDEVKVIYPDDVVFNDPKAVVESMKDISHSNHHHPETIGEHMLLCYVSAKSEEHLAIGKYAQIQDTVALVHDIGKPFTKVFTNAKGEPTTEAHFFNHQNVGAYDVFFLNIDEDIKIPVSLLVLFHMNYFMSWSQSSRARERDEKFLGYYLSMVLNTIHECDLKASTGDDNSEESKL